MGNEDQIEHQEERDDMPVNIPKWVLSSGVLMVFLLIVIGAMVLWSIKFPETVVAPAEIINQHAAVTVKTKTSGPYVKALVSNNDMVKKGDLLAIIENNAKGSDVLELKNILKKVKENNMEMAVLKSIKHKPLHLGSIQKEYLNFIKHLDSYLAINNEKTINKNNRFFKQQINILRKKYKRTNKAKRMDVSFEISQLEKKSFNYRNMVRNKRKNSLVSVHDAYYKLTDAIKIFDELHVLKAPVDGKVQLIHRTYKAVQKETPIMKIKPETNAYIAKLYFKSYPSGKIELGQPVNISLSAYPKGEYGLLSGRLVNIPEELTNSKLVLTVDLSDQLQTDLNVKIPYRQGLYGRASIILSDTRLLYRLFYQFRSIFK